MNKKILLCACGSLPLLLYTLFLFLQPESPPPESPPPIKPPIILWPDAENTAVEDPTGTDGEKNLSEVSAATFALVDLIISSETAHASRNLEDIISAHEKLDSFPNAELLEGPSRENPQLLKSREQLTANLHRRKTWLKNRVEVTEVIQRSNDNLVGRPDGEKEKSTIEAIEELKERHPSIVKNSEDEPDRTLLVDEHEKLNALLQRALMRDEYASRDLDFNSLEKEDLEGIKTLQEKASEFLSRWNKNSSEDEEPLLVDVKLIEESCPLWAAKKEFLTSPENFEQRCKFAEDWCQTWDAATKAVRIKANQPGALAELKKIIESTLQADFEALLKPLQPPAQLKGKQEVLLLNDRRMFGWFKAIPPESRNQYRYWGDETQKKLLPKGENSFRIKAAPPQFPNPQPMIPFYTQLADRYTQSRKAFIQNGVLNKKLFQNFIDEIESIRNDLKKYIGTFVKKHPHPIDPLVAHWEPLLDEIIPELEADLESINKHKLWNK
ncbi:MAG: hypothetical protein ACR2NF_07690 [Pirellulales bacterium]